MSLTHITGLLSNMNIGEIISNLISSAIVIYLLTHYMYKSKVKLSHKFLKLQDKVTQILHVFFYMSLIYPLFFLFFLLMMIIVQQTDILMIFSCVIMIILGISAIVAYVKAVRSLHKIKSIRGIWVRTKYIINTYLKVVFIMLVIITLNLLLIIISTYIIDEFANIQDSLIDYIILCLLFYLISSYLAFALLFSYEEDLRKKVKNVKIYYTQNGEISSDSNIGFESFDIDKDFFSFYSRTKNHKKVIQTKDLLRIEYYYDDKSKKDN